MFLKISFIVATIYFLRWLGFKGFLGIFVGLLGMAFILLTDNPQIKAILRLMRITNEKNNTQEEIRKEIENDKRQRVKFRK